MGSLRSLRLTTELLLEADWAFVERFSGTLEDLEPRFNSFGAEGTGPLLSAPFPRLRHLHLRGTPADIVSFLTFFSTSPLADIDLELVPDYAEEQNSLRTGSPLLVALALFRPTPRTLRCCPASAPTLTYAETANLRAFCQLCTLFEYSAYYSPLPGDAAYEVVERSVAIPSSRLSPLQRIERRRHV